MARIVHLADNHFNLGSRFDECVKMHGIVSEYVRREKPDAVAYSGDLFDGASNPIEREAVAEHVQENAQIAPVIVDRGNHDRVLDLAILRRLRAPHPIWVCEEPRVITVGSVAFGVLPWPRKAGIHAVADGLGLPASELEAQEALRSILRWMGSELDETGLPKMLVTHAMVDGSVTSHGQPLVGADMNIGLTDLALANADAYALGHIHKHQHWMIGDAPAVYPGSPYRTAFGELEPKGFVVWHIERGRATWEFIELPAAKMMLIDVDWQPEHVGLPGDSIVSAGFSQEFDFSGMFAAEIRFRYRVAAEHQKIARAAAEDLKRKALLVGAISFQIEPVVQVTTRERSPEIAEASTLQDQIKAYWKSTNNYPEPPVEQRLLGKLAILESEAAN